MIVQVDMISVYDRLKPGRPHCEEYEEIIKLRLDGHSYNGISYLLGVPRSTISTICKKNNLGGKIKEKYNAQKT